MKRRHFIAGTALSTLAACTAGRTLSAPQIPPSGVLKPKRLKVGDTIGLIAPAGRISTEQLQSSIAKVEGLGFKTHVGQYALAERGYLAGTDANRAADVNAMFADDRVDAILCLRGGYGCNRILGLLDYDLIRQNPKALIGYSDITALCLALYEKCRLVSFHGPVGISTWNDFSVDSLKAVLMGTDLPTFSNHSTLNPSPEVVQTYRNGTADGILLGGNLTVLTSLIGSSFLPDFTDKLLFLEEVEESPYKVDRMLMQLKLAGILDKIGGLIWGTCSNCVYKEGEISLSIEEVLADYFTPLQIPVYAGTQIGHISNKFTLPIGIQARMDATNGTISLLESAVSP